MTTIGNSSALLLNLFPSTGGSGFDISAILASGGASASASANAVDISVALKQAEANEERQLEQARKDPITQREIKRYNDVLDKAKSFEEFLDDPVARKVFLTANGLGDQTDFVGLAKKALGSNAFDPKSLANQLASINGAWINAVSKYNFNIFGLSSVKLPAARQTVADNYIKEQRLTQLEEQLPGLGVALQFKEVANTLTTATKVLGSGLGREVITKAFGIPARIAFQSLTAQEKAITDKLDVADLQDPRFVERVVYRYLLEVNGAGLSAGVSA